MNCNGYQTWATLQRARRNAERDNRAGSFAAGVVVALLGVLLGVAAAGGL